MASALESAGKAVSIAVEIVKSNLSVDEQKTLAEAMEAFKSKLNPTKEPCKTPSALVLPVLEKQNDPLEQGFRLWKLDQVGCERAFGPWNNLSWDSLLRFLRDGDDPARFDYAKFINQKAKIFTNDELLLFSYLCGKLDEIDNYLEPLVEKSQLSKDETFKLAIGAVYQMDLKLFTQISLLSGDWTFGTKEILTILALIMEISDEKEMGPFVDHLFLKFFAPSIASPGSWGRVGRILKGLNDPRFSKYF